MPRIGIPAGATGFVELESGLPFVPWGFNYNMDRDGRLLESYWHTEWATVEADFREMAALGANVVRIHLQTGRIMAAGDTPDRAELAQLSRLLDLAERTGLRLDITGLGCYLKQDVPPWYDALDEDARWAVQERFWEAVAATCATCTAVFCYDLMNEPVVAAGTREDWLAGAFGGQHFVQFINLRQAGRQREEIAVGWTRRLAAAIRRHDEQALVTVGLVDWSLPLPKRLYSGFDPKRIAPEVDFIAVHVYPERGKVDEALETLRGFDVGKPVVIEETFPLKCDRDEMETFLRRSKGIADGWISFYWGKTLEEMTPPETIPDAMMQGWLLRFRKGL